MKILVIQLARLGDIYISWPAIRALRRLHPEAEIHVLTRPKFSSALEGLTAVHKIKQLPTENILEPMINANSDIQESFDRLSNFCAELRNEEYDWVLNFSFSPFSSYLTHFITHAKTKVTGYTRFTDGYLCIPDDMSAYFYAQVGVGRPNRFHLVEIFASMVGADLTTEDWRAPHPFPQFNQILPSQYITLHIGASDSAKTLSAAKWSEIINMIHEKTNIEFVLIGSPEEAEKSNEILKNVKQELVMNLVGKTKVAEIFPILKSSELLIGCDSVAMHMANFTQTGCVNISLSTVNFWETGPRTIDSVIIRELDEDTLSSEKVVQIVLKQLNGEKQDVGVIYAVGGTPSYYALMPKDADFEWLMLRALYLSEDFPSNDSKDFKEAIKNLADVNELMIQQMENVEKNGKIEHASPFIERGEEIIETIGKLVYPVQSLIRWYQTEKIRIGPGEFKTVLARTIEVHLLLKRILDLYSTYHVESEKELS